MNEVFQYTFAFTCSFKNWTKPQHACLTMQNIKSVTPATHWWGLFCHSNSFINVPAVRSSLQSADTDIDIQMLTYKDPSGLMTSPFLHLGFAEVWENTQGKVNARN